MHFPASDLNPEQTYRLMSGIIVPRPIAWISSVNAHGVVNLAPFSCYTFVSNQPPMIGVNIGRKAGQRKDTGRNIMDNGHFVVNIADETLLDPLHESAQEHPPEVSEADLLGLPVIPGVVVATPAWPLRPSVWNAGCTASRRSATPGPSSLWAKS